MHQHGQQNRPARPAAPHHNRYHRAKFVTSAQHLGQAPTESVAEVAFAGRSNAGKSSALNAIAAQNKLARTSKTPGRTQLINFFELPEQRYLVDLPGYGYAKVSRDKKALWQRHLGEYLQRRPCLHCLFLITDARHPLTDPDWLLIDWTQQGRAELHVLLTKADKLSRNQRQKTLFATRDRLGEAGIEATLQLFSAVDKTGLDDAHQMLDMYLYPEHQAEAPQIIS